MAEVVAVRNGREGGRLSQSAGRIHEVGRMIGGLVLAARRLHPLRRAQAARRARRRAHARALAARDRSATVGRVVVVLGSAAEEIVANVNLHGVEPLVCPRWEEGQSASLAFGLAELADCEAVVVTLGDQPRVSPDAIRRVMSGRNGASAIRATYNGNPGHPVLLERELYEALRDVSRRQGRPQPSAQRAGARHPLRGPRRRPGRGHSRRARRAARGRPGDRRRPGQVKLEQSFEVRAPVERVWETLIDIERVAPCLPGAEITEAGDDGVYRGTFSIGSGRRPPPIAAG